MHFLDFQYWRGWVLRALTPKIFPLYSATAVQGCPLQLSGHAAHVRLCLMKQNRSYVMDEKHTLMPSVLRDQQTDVPADCQTEWCQDKNSTFFGTITGEQDCWSHTQCADWDNIENMEMEPEHTGASKHTVWMWRSFRKKPILAVV